MTWTEPARHGVPYGAPTEIPISVSGDDHPGAVLIALHAPRAVAAYQHFDDLADLSKDDLYHLLNSVRKLTSAAGAIEEELIVRLREAEPNASWAELGAALDVKRQAAKERYLRIKRAHEQGLSERGMAHETAENGRAGAGVTVIGPSVTITFGDDAR